MAECMVEECGLKTEPGATYEDAHKVMQRHLMTHLIEELRGIRASIPPYKIFSGAADAPKQDAPAPDGGDVTRHGTSDTVEPRRRRSETS